MFTHYNKYCDIVIAFPFGRRTSFLSSSEPLGRWPEGEKQGTRNVSGIFPARDPSALRFVGMTRDVRVNCYIITKTIVKTIQLWRKWNLPFLRLKIELGN